MHHLGLVVGRGGEVAANHGVSYVLNKRRIIRDRGWVSARYIEGGRTAGVVAERGSTVSVATWYR